MIIEDIEENLDIVKRESNYKPYAMHMNTKTFNDLHRECMGFTMIPPYGRLNFNGIEVWLRSDFENDYICFIFKENYGRSFYVGETKRRMDKSKEAAMDNKVTVRDEEKKREKIGVGSLWYSPTSEYSYILAATGMHHVKLIRLSNGKGSLTDAPVDVRDIENLTLGGWAEVRGNIGLTRIYNVGIEAEREG
jgi:hypothetical protein